MRFKKGDFVKIVNWEKAKSYEINCPSSYILCNEKIKNGMIGQIILSASHSYNPPRWCIQFKENMNFEEVIGYSWWIPTPLLKKLPKKVVVLYAL